MQEQTTTADAAIPKQGLHRMTDRAYFAIDLPSSSQTKVLATGTNAHLGWQREHPEDETDALTVGAYLHALLLQPQSIKFDFVVVPKVDRRTTAGKAEWAAAQAEADKRKARLINDQQVGLAEAMAGAAIKHKGVSSILRACEQREIVAIGEIAGKPAKCKIDGLLPAKNGGNSVCIVDVKTTVSASARDFSRSVISYGYAHQAAFYSRVLGSLGLFVEDVVFIAIEKERPHCVAVFRLPDVAMGIADHRIDALVERWWQVKAGDRTGYPEEIQELALPSWWLRGDSYTAGE